MSDSAAAGAHHDLQAPYRAESLSDEMSMAQHEASGMAVDLGTFAGPTHDSAIYESARDQLPRNALPLSAKSTRKRRGYDPQTAENFQDYLTRSFRSDWRLSTIFKRPWNGEQYTELEDLTGTQNPCKPVRHCRDIARIPSSITGDEESLIKRSSSSGSLDLATAPRDLEDTDADSSTERDRVEDPKLKYTMTGGLSTVTTADNRVDSNLPKTMWQPWELHRRTFLCFIIFYTVVMIALGLLYWSSERYQGLVSSNFKYHYGWTYGPTALLTIVSVSWHRIDYRIKQLQPWKLMATRPMMADHGLLLDYVSPMIGITLYRAIRNLHVPVILSIGVDLLLKLLIILSTSLLVLDSVTISESAYPMIATSRFSGGSYSASSIDASLTYVVVATSPLFNSTFPAWTQNGSAILPLTTTTPPPADSRVNIDVQAFVPDLGVCETGRSFVQPNLQAANLSGFYLNITGPSCSVSIPDPYLVTDGVSYLAVGTAVQCGLTNANTVLLYAMAIDSGNITDMAWSFCTPSFLLQTANVAYAPSTVPSSWTIVPETPSKIPGISEAVIFDGILSTFNQSGSLYDLWQWLLPNSTASIFDMNQWDPTIRYFYNNVAAQVGALYLKESANDPIVGTITYSEQRLVVRKLAVSLMETVLALLLAVTIWLGFIVPRNVVPIDPGSVGSLATILAACPDLTTAVANQGHTPSQHLRTILQPFSYHTRTTSIGNKHSFGIHQLSAPTTTTMAPADTANLRWWQPIGYTWIMITLSLAAPILLIVSLETILQLSQRTNGISAVSPQGGIRYSWVYLPAFLMVLVAMLFNPLVFAIRMTQPFRELRRGNAGSKTILSNNLKTPVVLLLGRALVRLDVAIAFACIIALITPLLTIVVSGLYAGQVQTVELSTPVQLTSWFNNSFQGWSPQSGRADFQATILQNTPDLPYPRWSWDTLVIPQIQLGSTAEIANMSALTSLNITLPTLQATLKCRNYTVEQAPTESDVTGYINVTSPIPRYWGDFFFSNPEEYYWTLPAPNNGSDYFGGFYYPACYVEGAFEDANCDPARVYGLVFFGYGNWQNYTLTTLVCDWPIIEEIQSDVVFSLPDYTIQGEPQPDYTTTKTFSNQSFLPEIWGSDVGEFDYINSFGNVTTSNGYLLPMLQVAIGGRHSDPDTSKYLDPDLLAERIEYAYNAIVAQYINQLFRLNESAMPADIASQRLTGYYTNPNITRLVQSSISTRILEALIGILFLCALFIHTTVTPRARRLLPKDPMSIAVMASLLAGSRLLSRDVIPVGAELMSEKELREQRIFEPYMYSMGWFEDDDGSPGEARGARDGDEDALSCKGAAAAMTENKRFGIDIGSAAWPEGRPQRRARRWWKW